MDEHMQREIKSKIHEIEEKSAKGEYIYRGEPEDYGKVSSNLWREYGIDGASFDVEVVQKEMLNDAKNYIGHLPQVVNIDFTRFSDGSQEESNKAVEFEILTEIQHYGGKTNLIDFTTDYLIGLFFACDGHHDKCGRVIVQKKDEIQNIIMHPRNPRHRVIAQKSVFVRPSKGFLQPNKKNIIIIPANLKELMLRHLQTFHGISRETIYNDLYGFIRYQDIHGGAYTHFYRGIVCVKKGEIATSVEKRRGEFHASIENFSRAIQENPNFSLAIFNRAVAYYKLCDYEHAIRDLDTAIDMSPNHAEAHYSRAGVYAATKNHEHALADLNTAIELTPNHVNAIASRGYVYARMDNLEKAIADCNRAIALDPNSSFAYTARGGVRELTGDYGHALADCNSAIELDPRNSDAYDVRGVVFSKLGDYESAIDDYTKAIDLDSSNGDYYYNRGEARLPLKQWDEARKDLVTAEEKGTDIIQNFRKEYGSVQQFQQKTGITLPEDIAQMLTPEEDS